MTSELWLVRHGETEWSRDHRHTSHTDLPLTDVGVEVAGHLEERLRDDEFELVLTSPRKRARRTAELAGFAGAVVDEDLVEWEYGDYEGITTLEIRETVPGWTVWTHPTPGGSRPSRSPSGWTAWSSGYDGCRAASWSSATGTPCAR